MSRTDTIRKGKQQGELALISLEVSTVPLCDPSAHKVATKDDHLWNEVVLDAVVKGPLNVSAWSNHTSEKKKKFMP